MSWVVGFYQALVHTGLASLLLLAVATVAVMIVRQPARRIRLIQCTFAGLVVLPCLAMMPGYPRWTILPDLALARRSARPIAEFAAEAPPVARPPLSESAPAPEAMPEPLDESAGDLLEEAGAISNRGSIETESVDLMPVDNMPVELEAADSMAVEPALPAIEASDEPGSISETPARWGMPRDYRFWVVASYFVGLLAIGVWSLMGLLALRRMLRGARPASATSRRMLREIAGPTSDRTALLISSRVGQPCAFGWRRTTIVLPEGFDIADNADRAMHASQGENSPAQKLRWALAHEWSHVERGDLRLWALATLVRCFYYYHPLLWWLRRQLQLSQDYLADSQAARAGASTEDYAEFLTVAVSRFARSRWAAGLGIGGRTSDLHRRVVMIVENRPLEAASPRRWNVAVMAAAVLVVTIVASLGERPYSAAAEPLAQAAPAELEPAVKEADTTNPGPSNADQPAPAAAKPSGPRKIAIGDALIVDVIPNIETAKNNQIPVVLPPSMTVVVDENGQILFGSHYSAVEVQGKNLSDAAGAITEMLVYTIERDEKREQLELRENARQRNVRELNVRVAFRTASTGRTPHDGKNAARVPIRLEPRDLLRIEATGTLPEAPIAKVVVVEPDGNVALGPHYGRVNVQGKTLVEAEQAIRESLQQVLSEPEVQATFAGRLRRLVAQRTG